MTDFEFFDDKLKKNGVNSASDSSWGTKKEEEEDRLNLLYVAGTEANSLSRKDVSEETSKQGPVRDIARTTRDRSSQPDDVEITSITAIEAAIVKRVSDVEPKHIAKIESLEVAQSADRASHVSSDKTELMVYSEPTNMGSSIAKQTIESFATGAANKAIESVSPIAHRALESAKGSELLNRGSASPVVASTADQVSGPSVNRFNSANYSDYKEQRLDSKFDAADHRAVNSINEASRLALNGVGAVTSLAVDGLAVAVSKAAPEVMKNVSDGAISSAVPRVDNSISRAVENIPDSNPKAIGTSFSRKDNDDVLRTAVQTGITYGAKENPDASKQNIAFPQYTPEYKPTFQTPDARSGTEKSGSLTLESRIGDQPSFFKTPTVGIGVEPQTKLNTIESTFKTLDPKSGFEKSQTVGLGKDAIQSTITGSDDSRPALDYRLGTDQPKTKTLEYRFGTEESSKPKTLEYKIGTEESKIKTLEYKIGPEDLRSNNSWLKGLESIKSTEQMPSPILKTTNPNVVMGEAKPNVILGEPKPNPIALGEAKPISGDKATPVEVRGVPFSESNAASTARAVNQGAIARSAESVDKIATVPVINSNPIARTEGTIIGRGDAGVPNVAGGRDAGVPIVTGRGGDAANMTGPRVSDASVANVTGRDASVGNVIGRGGDAGAASISGRSEVSSISGRSEVSNARMEGPVTARGDAAPTIRTERSVPARNEVVTVNAEGVTRKEGSQNRTERTEATVSRGEKVNDPLSRNDAASARSENGRAERVRNEGGTAGTVAIRNDGAATVRADGKNEVVPGRIADGVRIDGVSGRVEKANDGAAVRNDAVGRGQSTSDAITARNDSGTIGRADRGSSRIDGPTAREVLAGRTDGSPSVRDALNARIDSPIRNLEPNNRIDTVTNRIEAASRIDTITNRIDGTRNSTANRAETAGNRIDTSDLDSKLGTRSESVTGVRSNFDVAKFFGTEKNDAGTRQQSSRQPEIGSIREWTVRTAFSNSNTIDAPNTLSSREHSMDQRRADRAESAAKIFAPDSATSGLSVRVSIAETKADGFVRIYSGDSRNEARALTEGKSDSRISSAERAERTVRVSFHEVKPDVAIKATPVEVRFDGVRITQTEVKFDGVRITHAEVPVRSVAQDASSTASSTIRTANHDAKTAQNDRHVPSDSASAVRGITIGANTSIGGSNLIAVPPKGNNPSADKQSVVDGKVDGVVSARVPAIVIDSNGKAIAPKGITITTENIIRTQIAAAIEATNAKDLRTEKDTTDYSRRFDSDKLYISGVEVALAVLIAAAGVAKSKDEKLIEALKEHILPYPFEQEDSCHDDAMTNEAKDTKAVVVENEEDESLSAEAFDASVDRTSGTESGVVLHRPVHIVAEGDDLVTLAEELFDDARLAGLIADVNKSRIRETRVAEKRIIELKCRQVIELPVWQDIVEYGKQEIRRRETVITVISSSEIDKELLTTRLSTALGLGPSSQPSYLTMRVNNSLSDAAALSVERPQIAAFSANKVKALADSIKQRSINLFPKRSDK